MAEAIQGIIYCDCWTYTGIYCFWDYCTNEILYLGLASDLLERFKQHNDLIKCNPNSCKSKQITGYFQEKKKLGYSMMLQSSLIQPITKSYAKKRKMQFNDSCIDYPHILGYNAFKIIYLFESINIEAVKAKTDRLYLRQLPII
jgi:hypothetical protein